MRLGEVGPGLDARLLHCPGHQLMTQLQRRLLTLLLVTGTDALAFQVIHQRQIGRLGKGALAELHGGADIDQGNIAQEQRLQVAGILTLAHHTQRRRSARGRITRFHSHSAISRRV